MYDTIIIGGGPAGVSAGVYAARKKLKTLVIAEEIGGQSMISDNIENWIGTKAISGFDLAKNLEGHLRAQVGINVRSGEKVLAVKEISGHFLVTTSKDEYHTKTVIVAIGARRRHLGVPGEREFEGKGVVYCSTCDAPLFAGKSVAVIGGGNAGLEAIEDLIPYAKEIYLLDRSTELSGDAVTIERIKKSPRLKEIIFQAETVAILGEKFVTGLKYRGLKTNEEKIIAVHGIFVEIGTVPNSELVKNLVKINSAGEIIIDHRTAATSQPGVFAAGDITDVAYKQNNISAGDAVKAALSAYEYVKGKR